VLSKQHIKYLNALSRKKDRQKYGQFLVEGEKSVMELLNSTFKVIRIYQLPSLSYDLSAYQNIEIIECSAQELERISTLKNTSGIIALAEIPEVHERRISTSKWYIALDRINDPGNLGTIIRIADWFGIEEVLCSRDTVELYNPKTLMACMGSFARVRVRYCDLELVLSDARLNLYYALLGGEDLSKMHASAPGIIVIGNEANGIQSSLLDLPHQSVTIPGSGQAESLNAAISAGIICYSLIHR
jgi:TrmH family RNA methyltransferase